MVRVFRRSEIIEIFILLSLLIFMEGTGRAQEIQCGPSGPSRINLITGKSAVIQCQDLIKRISIAAPEVADATALSPRQIYITGKSAGSTNLLIWDSQEKVRAMEVEVLPDITRLKEKLHEMFPDEENIKVSTSNNKIVLSGTVTSLSRMSQVMAIAGPFAVCPKEEKEKGGTQVFVSTEGAEEKGAGQECTNITNLLEIGGVQQVMLEVRVSEIQRSLAKRLGVNFKLITQNGDFGLTLFNNLRPISPTLSEITGLTFDFTGDKDISFTSVVDILKENGLIKVLAEPTLLTLSGQTANFLAGGEFPILVPQGFQTVTIDYKQFGVGLSFTPTVLSSGHINMKVAPEVSDLDFTTAVTLGGLLIPGLTTRRVSTTIELADGQSFAIAGLLKDNVREVVSKFPLLGDIPILGALFRSTSFQKNETELVVIVTPRLVKPLDPSEQTLPTDEYIEPSDLEFYLNGQMEGRTKPETKPEARLSSGKPEGKFGYIIP